MIKDYKIVFEYRMDRSYKPIFQVIEDGIIIKEIPVLKKEYSKTERKEQAQKFNVDRYEKFPDKLPTMDIMPYPPEENEEIGTYENKQDLYLYIAHAYNILLERVKKLETEVETLKNG